ncbi:ABC transporter ATP-binding protein/permease wht-1-like [Dendronephthya gigantea]|uniref:ABC transporter ATP-binding protein/permease wht-1-like n=1 Tax=Dendronephthya gigantea TaxID=151771 RepID=UPI00106D6317|nr:ABC transporter ATP-binding protein/permease wht-1-like [Dendronephthya gigantea]
MDRNQLLNYEGYETPMYPSYGSSDSNPNIDGYENGRHSHSGLRKQSSLNTFNGSKRSIDLSSTFETSQIVLGWEDINVFVHKQTGLFDRCLKRGRGNIEFVVNQILNEVNGEIPSKSLVAILGPRGAGKTTLLNALAHRRIEQLEVTGTVYVREEPVGINIREVSAYVEDHDVFVGLLTVREHLIFQAFLRMGSDVSREDKISRVEAVMEEFGLKDWEHAQIGSPDSHNGVPREITKSLSIASELLSSKKFILFADDPLTGLDSLSSNMLVHTLQRLANSGYTILCTLDQPTSDVYALFNKIILLAEGRITYLGPSSEAVSYFGSIGFPCPENYNPADFFIRTLTVNPTEYEQSVERIKYVCDKYREIEIRPRARSALGPIESFDDPDKKTVLFHAGRFTQFLIVLWRSFIIVKRDKNALFLRTIQAVILGFITGQVYFQLDEDQEDIRNFSGLLFFLVLNITFCSFQGVLFTFPLERDIFIRENEKGIYCTSVYFLAKSLVGIPLDSILTITLMSIAYWMSGLRETSEAFFLACATALLVCHTSVSFGYFVSTATNSLSRAIATGPILILPLLIFGGYFVSNNTIPDSLKWLRYISWFNFGFENLMINQWQNVDRITGCGKTTSKHCLQNGEQVLDFYQLDENNFKRNFWLLAALCITYRLLAYIFLLRNPSRTR